MVKKGNCENPGCINNWEVVPLVHVAYDCVGTVTSWVCEACYEANINQPDPDYTEID